MIDQYPGTASGRQARLLERIVELIAVGLSRVSIARNEHRGDIALAARNGNALSARFGLPAESTQSDQPASLHLKFFSCLPTSRGRSARLARTVARRL
jgi:hypothetical protein